MGFDQIKIEIIAYIYMKENIVDSKRNADKGFDFTEKYRRKNASLLEILLLLKIEN